MGVYICDDFLFMLFDIKFESSYYVYYDYLILYSNRAIIWYYCLIDVNVWYVWYQLNGEKVNNQKTQKTDRRVPATGFWVSATGFTVADAFTWRQQKSTATKKIWSLIRYQRPGWRHLATGDVIWQASATMLSATGVSATVFYYQRPDWASATGDVTIRDRFHR